MANITAAEHPKLVLEMTAMERTTPAHYDEWNVRHQQLLDNDKYLNEQFINVFSDSTLLKLPESAHKKGADASDVICRLDRYYWYRPDSVNFKWCESLHSEYGGGDAFRVNYTGVALP